MAKATATNKRASKTPAASSRRQRDVPHRERYSSPSDMVAAAAAAAGMAAIAAERNNVEAASATRRDDGWLFPPWDPHVADKNKKHYRSYFMDFMTFFHRRQGKEVPAGGYPLTKMFTREELLEISPRDVHDWMAIKAFGKVDYGPGDKSTGARLTTLEYMKKAVSSFMPNKRPYWQDGRGNPTKSDMVNDLLKKVQTKQVRKMGAKSQVKRQLRKTEMEKEIEIMRGRDNWEDRIKFVAMAVWQFNFIARIDDTCHHELFDVKGHKTFTFALQSKVRWSKNVVDERKCPDQIILGANDPLWCLILLLGVYLETYLESHPDPKYLFTEKLNNVDGVDMAPDNLKNKWRSHLKKFVWNTSDFKDVDCGEDEDEGGVGTHSRRKFAADYAANCGQSDMAVEIRGRWKRKGNRIVFQYIGLKKSFEDAAVCAALCIGGPIKYELKQGLESLITPDWIFANVIPNIREKFSDTTLCTVLGKAVLYACMSEEDRILVPDNLKQRVRTAYNQLNLEETQPVKKVPLHVHRLNDRLMISPILEGDEVAGVGGHGGMPGNEAMQTILLRQHQYQVETNQRFDSLGSQMWDMRNFFGRQLKQVNNNIRSFGGTIEGSFVRQRTQRMEAAASVAAPSRSDTNRSQDEVGAEQLPLLSHNVSSLHELWMEYKFGLNGRKPAEQFTTRERNVSKATSAKYCRRKIVWDCIQRIINSSGCNYTHAIRRIRDVYGWNTSTTQTMFLIKADKKRFKDHGGIHPNLR